MSWNGPPPIPPASRTTDQRDQPRLFSHTTKRAFSSKVLLEMLSNPTTYDNQVFMLLSTARTALQQLTGTRIASIKDMEFAINTGSPVGNERRYVFKMHQPVEGTLELVESIDLETFEPVWDATLDGGRAVRLSSATDSFVPAMVTDDTGRNLRAIQL